MLCIHTIIVYNSARGRDKCLMHVLVVFAARAATVATHPWTKLHAHPAASSLANFNDTISTISTTQLFIYISCSHQTVLVGHTQQLFCPLLKQLHVCLVNYQVLSPRATLLLFLASKLPCECDAHEPHSQINTEPFSSHGVCPAFRLFSPAKYTLLICCHVHMLPKRGVVVFGVWSILPFIIKCIFTCNFGNKRMRLLTCVYSMQSIGMWFSLIIVVDLIKQVSFKTQVAVAKWKSLCISVRLARCMQHHTAWLVIHSPCK